MSKKQIIECVPNFSEGRDSKKIESIANAIRSIAEVQLLHIDSGYDANRTVFTLIGPPEAVLQAMLSAFRTARQLCDMSQHLGTHPRIGLLDVCPFIPLQHISIAETANYAESFAQQLSEEFDQTIYLYEQNASSSLRKNLANIRRGEYEGLSKKLSNPHWAPDMGSKSFLPRTGATIIGARPFLIAFNINLDTKLVSIATKIAERIRTSGYKKELTPGGLREKIHGLLPAVKAIGWYVDEYQCAQVSMNLINFSISGMHEAYEACKHIAKDYKVQVTGSELIGLVPLKAILAAGRYYATQQHLLDRSEKALIDFAIEQLGLESKKPFIPQEHIIDYQY